MIFKSYLISLLFFPAIILLGCKNNRVKIESTKELLQVMGITNCDSLFNNEIFKENSKLTWPNEKPTSILAAVKILDSMTNEFHDHCLKICPSEKFYFSFGMAIRNVWFHQGTPQFRNQIENKLKQHPDISSGLVISLYLKLKKNEKVNFAEIFDKEYLDELDDQIIKEFEIIQREVNELIKIEE